MARKRDEPVRLTKIYTRGGDAGETSLGDGSRVPKTDPRIAAVGAVEELNAQLGLAIAAGAFADPLERIQNELFDVGADFAVPFADGDGKLRVEESQVQALEADCDRFNEQLEPLKSFVLPGGTEAAARLHLARTVCRRAELTALAVSPANPTALRYVNRLSDLLFILARAANARRGGAALETWQLALGAAGSFVAGYLGSALGLVLGTLRLPLILLLASSPAAGAGTNIGISAASAASGSLRHAREGRVSWRVVAWMLPPSIVGAALGGYFGSDLPEAALLGVAAAILAFNGTDLLLRPFHAKPRTKLRIAPAVAGGLGVGALGGAIGVILGTMRMPVLLRGVGMTAAKAVGTNLVVGFAVGTVGLAAHAARTEVDWELLAVGAPAALVGGWFGAKLTGRLSEIVLRRAIGIALIVIAVALAIEAIVR